MRIDLLDHGYIQVVESWGSDERIIEAARMSTGKGFQGWGPMCPNATAETDHEHDLRRSEAIGGEEGGNLASEIYCVICGPVVAKLGDEKLLAYLWNNKHATPFEMAGLIVEVQAPIFVFREWHRHRTQSYNELSARYTPLPDINYVPSIERLMVNAGGSNKQAGTVAGSEVLTESKAVAFQKDLLRSYALAQGVYEYALGDGVPKELARLSVPVGRYSRMRASANLRNWLGFLLLRQAPNAQWEIRQYANAVGSVIAETFPRTWELFAKENTTNANSHS